MNLSKKTEYEILKVYDAWLYSYLNGDVATYDSYLDEAYHFIGSTGNEEFLNRKDTTNFFKATAEQFSGKTETRNESRILEQFGELVFITHLFDAWFLNEEEWTYYGRFRFTSTLQEREDGWRFIYQHFSTTDSKTEEGETIGYTKVNDENLQLREAIRRRTIELEVKNRELEVEAALARIRTQVTDMNQSADLLDIVVTMRKEFTNLGHEAHYFWHMRWLPEIYEKAMTSGDGTRIGMVMELPRNFHGIEAMTTWEGNTEPTAVFALDVDVAVHYIDKMIQVGNFKVIDHNAPTLDDIRHIGGLTFIMARTTHGEIGYSLPGVVANPPAEDLEILARFAKVFDLAHKRFEDLRNSEAQLREAKVEAAIEKVRSRTLSMQHSDELAEASKLLDEQVRSLGINTWGCAFHIYHEEETPSGKWDLEWFSSAEGVLPPYKTPRENVFSRYYEMREHGEALYVEEKSKDNIAKHYDYLKTLPVLGETLNDLVASGVELPTYQIDHVAYFKQGYLLFITFEEALESHDIFTRFAKVFEQTYTRFLDLQKAEAQAREAQIEAALERVRARTMAIQKQDDLLDVITLLADQLVQLGIELDSANFSNGLSEKDWDIWIYNRYFKPGMQTSRVYYPWIDHPMFQEIETLLENFKKGIDLNVAVFSKAELSSFVDYVFTNTVYKEAEDASSIRDEMRNLPGYTWSAICLKDTWVSMNRFDMKPFTDEENAILRRFANAFGQAYTRFLDVQKAEEQAREAQIEAGLERVRSRTMGMQKSDELGDVATILFKELNQLVDNLWTCGFVLCEKERQEDEWWLSAENGFIPSFYIPNIGDRVHENMYKAWKVGKAYHTEEIEGRELDAHYDWLMSMPAAKKVFDDMLATGFELPTWQKLHCAYFKTGYLVMITQVPCEEEDIFKRFAQVFDLTYTRFLDLQLKEQQALEISEEKQRLERTLSDLQETQKQLIHSEKMASLGELTAGIAHEIQNPLNFVNNFSEVSHELMDEMNIEIDNGDIEEAKTIASDIKQNLEKISHHGKRADSIVKGMLQHSRQSTSVKEATDINKLVDEYVRLAYHGLRAKDKSFNVALNIDLNSNLDHIDLIPQDIGRVVLNIFTNACYAVSEKKSKSSNEAGAEKYEPTVSVDTKKRGDQIVITIRDNGSGIPQNVIDKIFQPFFTTKPTGEGTGLGLSMSYDIMQAHSGDLKVESEPGLYTEFSIVLPV